MVVMAVMKCNKYCTLKARCCASGEEAWNPRPCTSLHIHQGVPVYKGATWSKNSQSEGHSLHAVRRVYLVWCHKGQQSLHPAKKLEKLEAVNWGLNIHLIKILFFILHFLYFKGAVHVSAGKCSTKGLVGDVVEHSRVIKAERSYSDNSGSRFRKGHLQLKLAKYRMITDSKSKTN